MLVQEQVDSFVQSGFHYTDFDLRISQGEIDDFSNYWNNLAEDQYIEGDFKYRLRRYSKIRYNFSQDVMQDLGSFYYQEKEHNQLYGGDHRDFAGLEPDFMKHPLLKYFLRKNYNFFKGYDLIEGSIHEMGIHMMRTISDSSSFGLVTPEGVHKDGHFAFGIHLMNRENVEGGVTNLYDNEMQPLASEALQYFGQTLFIEDDRLYHEVTPVANIDKNRVGVRDVMIIEFY